MNAVGIGVGYNDCKISDNFNKVGSLLLTLSMWNGISRTTRRTHSQPLAAGHAHVLCEKHIITFFIYKDIVIIYLKLDCIL